MPKSAHRPMARRQVRTPRTLAGKLIKPLAGGAAVLLVAGSLVTVGLLQPDPAAADSFTPATSASGASGESFILAGEDATIDIAVANESADPKYNLGITALVPNGVALDSSAGLGTPVIYPSGAPLANNSRSTVPSAADCAPLVPVGSPSLRCAVPAGFQLWVWENVSDLPAGAELNSAIVVRPDADAFPVGTDALDIVVTAFTSDDPTMLPVFDGSSSVATDADHTSQPGSSVAETEIRALRIAKSEPSPEQELLRGVHHNSTTYEIVVENSGQGATGPVTVIDHLPAGLEYLGRGGVDNTASSADLFDASGSSPGTLEYPGAASLTATPAPADGLGDWGGLAETVETVEYTAAEATALGLPGPGVYTKVTWEIGTLSGGTVQDFPADPGAPGEYVIRYRAGIPLFANTMDWDGAVPALDGPQGSNLNNNSGASTRHGEGADEHIFAQGLTNTATASGDYQGAVASESDRPQFDSAQVTVEAVDLRVVKTVDGDAFVTGGLADYTLDIATSEYTSSSAITLTDRIANGLCPAFPAQTPSPELRIDGAASAPGAWNVAVSPGFPECDYPYSGSETAAVSSELTIDWIDFDTVTGAFVVQFTIDDLAADAAIEASYTIHQRQRYIDAGSQDGATSSGDSMVNTVEIRGTTDSIDALDGVENATGTPAYGVENVLDDSRAEIFSDYSGLTKKVLERGETLATADHGDWAVGDHGDWVDRSTEVFAPGDSVWYRIRIEFPDGIDTRNPKLTDFLPEGVAYVGASYSWQLPGTGAANDSATPEPDHIGQPSLNPAGNPRVLTWELGSDEAYTGSDDRFIPFGSWIEITVEGRVVGQSASPSLVDKPENHAKYQQENVDGDVFFLRDAAAVDLDHPASLVKGVRDVDDVPVTGGDLFGSPRDGVEVVQDDVVTYRINVTAPETDVTDLIIWDALPPGIRAADVDTAAFTAALYEQVGSAAGTESLLAVGSDVSAVALDPGDPGYPLASEIASDYTGRSLIMWTVSAMVPGSDATTDTLRGLTLGYDVVIPDGDVADGGDAAEITRDYVNVASIVNYAVVNNNPAGGGNEDGTSTLVPVGPGAISTTPPTADEFDTPVARTFDPSNVFLPGAELEKELVSTEVAEDGTSVTDDNNGADQIVQGEHATFRYAVTIPAHASVAGGVLADDGVLRWTGLPDPQQVDYELVSATAPVPSFLTGSWSDNGFAFDATTGTLTFPPTYQNSSDVDQVFEVQITVWVADRDFSDDQYDPDLRGTTMLSNTATFGYTNPNSGTPTTIDDDAEVEYIEPGISVTKEADPNEEIGIDTPVNYTITVSNSDGSPISYDNVITDTVPPGILVDLSTVTPAYASADPGVATGDGGDIVWSLSELHPGESGAVEFGYTAQVDPTTGGGDSYTNEVVLVGYTLPAGLGGDVTDRRGDRASDSQARIDVVSASIAKGVRIAGDTADYGGTIEAPIGETAEYRVVVTLEPNISYYDPQIVDTLPSGVQYVAGSASAVIADPATGIDGSWSLDHDSVANTLSWSYTGGVADGDILDHSTERSLTLSYRVLLADTVAADVDDLDNTAEFLWNTVDDEDETQKSVEDGAEVDVLNPELTIAKSVDNSAPNPGESFGYEIMVTNVGDTAAHNAVVSDDVPPGVVVDVSTITPTPSGYDIGITTGDGGTITWDETVLTGPLSEVAPDNSWTFGYSAVLIGSAGIAGDESFTNVASVDHYESFPSGGRFYDPTDVEDDATVDPPFPFLVPEKSVTGASSVAYAGSPFSWTLEVTNEGDGPAQTATVLDQLPANWSYDTVSSVTVAGTAVTPVPAPTGLGTAASPLTWTFGDPAPAEPILEPGESIVIVFTAVPDDPAALTDPGVTQPGPVAVPHTNTVSAGATDTSGAPGNEDGPYADDPDTADAFIHSADLEIEKTAVTGPILAGTTELAWEIVVSNNGPDTAVGPFTVSDETEALPAGVSVASVGGTGWSCATPASDPDGVTTFDCVRSNVNDTLAAGAEFPAIAVQLTVAADFDPAVLDDGEVDNTATVTSDGTHDPDPTNNEDEDGVPIDTAADLAIAKTVTTSPVVAGESITWQLSPRNDGPSVSRSSALDPITITDEIPAGISNVADPSTDDWEASTPGGFPASAGDVITWSYTGSELPVGPAETILLTGDIDPDWTPDGELENVAEIVPGPTDDPDRTNNEDDVPVTPSTDTTIAVVKTRMVLDDGDWVPAGVDDPVAPGTEIDYFITVTNTGGPNARNVTVVDELPAYLSYVSVDSVDGSWTRTTSPDIPTGDQSFALSGDLAPGASATLRITVLVAASHTDDVVNWVEADADNADPDRDPDDSGSARQADLSVVKGHSGTATAGESIQYTITVTNDGPSDSSGPIEIVDTLPAGFGYADGTATVSIAGGPTAAAAPSVSGQQLTWTIGSTDPSFVLADEATIVLVFTATIAADTPATPTPTNLVNRVVVNGPDDPTPGDEYDDPTDVETRADMTIVKTVVSDAPHVAGETVEYQLLITNEGPSIARDVRVVDTPETGLTIVAIDGTGWDCDVDSASCERDDHPVGSSTITVTAEIAADVLHDDELDNLAELSWTDSRGPQEDDDPEPITVTAQADLEIVKTAVDAEGEEVIDAVAGTQLRYLLEVSNNGPSDAVGPLTVVDALPAGFGYVGIADGAAAWSCELDVDDSQLIECTNPSGLAAGGTAQHLVLLVLIDPAQGEGESVNTATVSSPTTDPVPENNEDDAPVVVERAVNLSIEKTHVADEVRIGDALAFQLTVVNHGPSTATDILVEDVIPAGLDYMGFVGDGWSEVSVTPDPDSGETVVVFALADALDPGATAAVLEVTVDVQVGAYPSVTNVAAVEAAEPETDESDNTSEDPVEVPPQSTLVLVKEAIGEFQVGSDAQYRITLTNLGVTEDPGPIVIEDDLPVGLSYVAASGAGVECGADGQLVSCLVLEPLAVDETIVIDLTVRVGNAAYPEVTNTAIVTTPTEQLEGSDPTDSATSPVAADPLARSGAEFVQPLIAAAVIVLLGGAVLLIIGRRRRDRSALGS